MVNAIGQGVVEGVWSMGRKFALSRRRDLGG